MGEERPRWLLRIGLVVAGLVLVPVVAVSVVVLNTWRPLREAGKANEQLEARFGAPGSYTPSPEGAFEPPRIEAFLQVQRELVPTCERYEPIRRAFRHVGGLNESEEPILKDAWTTVGTMFDATSKITPFVGKLFEERNRALLAAGMSLDEYNYLYVCAYREQLADEAVQRELFSDEVAPSPELMDSFHAMIVRQHASSEGEMKRALTAELDQLSNDPTRYPWRTGLPPATARSLAGYRTELDRLFCPGTAGIAMDRSPDRALQIALE